MGSITHPLSHGTLGPWLSTQSLCGRGERYGVGCWGVRPRAPKPPQIPLPRGQFSTHSLALFSWVSRDSFGSSGAWGSLSNKSGLQPCAEAEQSGQGLGDRGVGEGAPAWPGPLGPSHIQCWAWSKKSTQLGVHSCGPGIGQSPTCSGGCHVLATALGQVSLPSLALGDNNRASCYMD